MAIGRVAGPMLLSTLDRQGVDLNFVTDPGSGSQSLLYLDFSNFRMGVNTSVTTERLTVDGNISVNSYIKTSTTNQHMYLLPNGTGQAIISNVNVLKGNINATDIGSTTAAAAKFTTANTSAKATFASAQVNNLTPGRIVFSDGTGLNDDADLLFFTSNNTFYATTIESAGTVGYSNLNITGELKYPTYGIGTYVPYFAANGMFVASPGLRYFSGNAVLRANSVQVGNQVGSRVAYLDSSNAVVTSSSLLFDGLNLTATGITRLSGLQFSGQTISGVGGDADILLVPDGLGAISVQDHRITDIPNPVLASDAVNKQYVDDRITVSSANRIYLVNSEVAVQDNGFGLANVTVTVAGTLAAKFTDTYTYIGDYAIFNNELSTVAGDIALVPADNNRIRLQTTSSAVLPVGLTSERPAIPEIGDLRYNNEIGSIEWYTGAAWVAGNGATTVTSQIIYPTGSTASFTLTQNADTDSVLVTINGTLQQPTVAYTVTGTTLTLVETPLVTDIVEVRFLAAAIVYAANPIFVNTTYTSVSVSGTTLDYFYVVQYRSAVYEFTAKNTSGGRYQVGEIYLIHNNITANAVATVKSIMGTPTTPLINWTTSIDGFGVLSLVATAVGSGTEVKIHRTYFNDA